MHKPAFDLHNSMDGFNIDALITPSIQCPMNGSDASMRLRIDDGSDFFYKAFIEPVATSFFWFPV